MTEAEKKAEEYLKIRTQRMAVKTENRSFKYSGYEEELIKKSYIDGLRDK